MDAILTFFQLSDNPSPLVIIGTVFGAVAVLEGFLVFLLPDRGRMIGFKFLSDILWFVNHLFLGLYTAAALNVIALAREPIFYFRDKKSFASHRFWLPLFIVLTLASPLTDCCLGRPLSAWSLLPAVGSVLTVVVFYQRRPVVSQYLALVAQSLWLIYEIKSRNGMGVASNVVFLASALVGILRGILCKRRTKAPEAADTPTPLQSENDLSKKA